jgi:membrane protein
MDDGKQLPDGDELPRISTGNAGLDARHLHAVVFAAIYRVLPTQRYRGGTLPWAHLSQPYSTLGKSLIGIYLGRAAPSSPYGAAGELIVLMFRMHYSGANLPVWPSSPKRSLTSESLAAPPQRGTIQAGVNSS